MYNTQEILTTLKKMNCPENDLKLIETVLLVTRANPENPVNEENRKSINKRLQELIPDEN